MSGLIWVQTIHKGNQQTTKRSLADRVNSCLIGTNVQMTRTQKSVGTFFFFKLNYHHLFVALRPKSTAMVMMGGQFT